MSLLLGQSKNIYIFSMRTLLHLLQHSCCGRTNIVTLVCENSSNFGEQTREMLLQQGGVGGQQLSQT